MSQSPEFRIIDLLRRRCAAGASEREDVTLGIGDDAAITRLPAGRELVTATDTLVCGTHFLPDAAAMSVGHRSLAVNLSDLAAMGATPRWATLSLALPEADDAWVDAFATGFAAIAAEHDVALIGGDTVRGPLAVTVTLLGDVAPGRALLRNGARPGDLIYVSGRPGCAGAGCRIALQTLVAPASDVYSPIFDYPRPRVTLGSALADIATAAIDVSDGVAIDLQRLLHASDAGAECSVPPLGSLADDFGAAIAVELFLTGGEDFELLFTAATDAESAVHALSVAHDVEITCIGQVTSAADVRWDCDGEPLPPGISLESFEHFQE